MLEKRWQHYEAKRLNRVSDLKQLRLQVVDEEKKGFWSPQVTCSINSEEQQYAHAIEDVGWRHLKVHPNREVAEAAGEDKV
ncbi:unnamed protein product [Sphagnum balticum]